MPAAWRPRWKFLFALSETMKRGSVGFLPVSAIHCRNSSASARTSKTLESSQFLVNSPAAAVEGGKAVDRRDRALRHRPESKKPGLSALEQTGLSQVRGEPQRNPVIRLLTSPWTVHREK